MKWHKNTSMPCIVFNNNNTFSESATTNTSNSEDLTKNLSINTKHYENYNKLVF